MQLDGECNHIHREHRYWNKWIEGSGKIHIWSWTCWVWDAYKTTRQRYQDLFTYSSIKLSPYVERKGESNFHFQNGINFNIFACQGTLSFDNLITMCLNVHLFEFILVWSLLSFCMNRLILFHQIWKFFGHYHQIFCLFLCFLFWDSDYVHVSTFAGVAQVSEALQFLLSFLLFGV